MRMFVGITPPESAIEDLDAFLEPRREYAALRWIDPEQFHVTLAFCPDVPDHALDAFSERLAEVAARHPRFAMRITGGGAFPDPDRAKVLYAALDTDRDRLTALALGCRTAAAVSGVEVAGGHYHPHVTVARSGRPVSAMRWLRILDAYGGPSFEVEEFHLVASHLGQGRERRPRYEIVETFTLGATATR